MIRSSMLLPAMSLLLSLQGCSGGSSAGTTSETENEILVRVTGLDGMPAAQVKVTLVDADGFDSLVAAGQDPRLDSAVTDSAGYSRMTFPADLHSFRLLAQRTGFATVLLNSVRDSLSSVELRLNASGAVRGTAPAGSWVRLDQLGLFQIADSSGHYEFRDVPQGYYAVFSASADLAEPSVQAVQVLPGDTATLAGSDPGLLVDDFDDGDAITQISSVGGSAPWYLYADSGTTFSPAGVLADPALAFTTADAWSGRALDLSIHLDTSSVDELPYGSIACPLAGVTHVNGYADLSGLDSVAFRVKGSGRMRILFSSRIIHEEYPDEDKGSDLGFTFDADSTWRRIVVPVDSLRPPDATAPALDSLRWHSVSDAIDLLVFGSWDSPGATVRIQLDDIRLYGVPYTVFR